jgi:hypothetical protein
MDDTDGAAKPDGGYFLGKSKLLLNEPRQGAFAPRRRGLLPVAPTLISAGEE